MADQYTCTGSGVRIRSGPGTNYGQVGTLYKGQVVEFISQNGNWINHSAGGWSSSNYLQLSKKGEESTVPPATNATEEIKIEQSSPPREEADLDELEEEKDPYPMDESLLLDELVDNERQYLNNLDNSLKVSTTRGIHGMPYQFLPVVDNRINNNASNTFGRKYAEKIVARMPLLIMVPGIPKFMSGYSSADKMDVLERGLGVKRSDSRWASSMSQDGKYYSLKMEYKLYYDYVNALCKAMANYLGIGRERIRGGSVGGGWLGLGSFDWLNDIESDLKKICRQGRCVAFYIDSDKQISESMSNDTTESMIKQSINGLSDYAREAQFLLGTTSYATRNGAIAEATDRFMGQEGLQDNIENVNNFINNIMLGNGGIFSRLTSNIQTLVAGGKLVFPELWSDSSFGGRSYDVNIKLRCPNPTKLALFLDILVPIAHIICAMAPRAATANGYVSPFLVRAYYKGMFNVDMGIITSLSITRGNEGSWSREGIPTAVDVNFTIKDLYSSLTISKDDSSSSGMINNTALMDYLANWCGININEPEVLKQIQLWIGASDLSKGINALRFDIFRGLEQWKDNFAYDIYANLFR